MVLECTFAMVAQTIKFIWSENFCFSLCWQAEEAREHCKTCHVDVGVKRVDLANTKSEIITQLREMVSQCDLTLKAVSLKLY